MIGVIVAGHGNFAEGILSSIELIAGKPDEVEEVNFIAGQSTEELKQNLLGALDRLTGEEILIMTDLMGGTPFNVSVLLKSERTDKKIRVIAGTNLPALVEAVFSREGNQLEELIDAVTRAGMDGIVDSKRLEEGMAMKEEAEEGI